MPTILAIDTSTTVCSIAILLDDKIVYECILSQEKSHAENLTLLIQNACEVIDFQLSDLDAVAVCSGPGSYTGLRIGVATAKGLCMAIEKPLIAVNSLQAMASTFYTTHPNLSDYLAISMLDARRMEVFMAIYNQQLEEVEKIQAHIFTEDSFKSIENQKLAFIGNANEKAEKVLNLQNALFISSILPSAQSVAKLALEKFNKNEFEDVAYFEPFYLKDFVSTSKPVVSK